MLPILDKMEVIFKCFARTPEEVIAAKGVKPTLSPNLDTLALVEVNLSFLHVYILCFCR
jgi:coenzyme F420-reducing hydrogenase beta subunit